MLESVRTKSVLRFLLLVWSCCMSATRQAGTNSNCATLNVAGLSLRWGRCQLNCSWCADHCAKLPPNQTKTPPALCLLFYWCGCCLFVLTKITLWKRRRNQTNNEAILRRSSLLFRTDYIATPLLWICSRAIIRQSKEYWLPSFLFFFFFFFFGSPWQSFLCRLGIEIRNFMRRCITGRMEKTNWSTKTGHSKVTWLR